MVPPSFSSDFTRWSAAEREFFKAIEDYKKRSGRQFPTWSEILEVARSLGYSKEGLGPDEQPPASPRQ